MSDIANHSLASQLRLRQCLTGNLVLQEDTK